MCVYIYIYTHIHTYIHINNDNDNNNANRHGPDAAAPACSGASGCRPPSPETNNSMSLYVTLIYYILYETNTIHNNTV